MKSNYPTPNLHKGQELAHIDYTLDGKKRKIPIAAYPVESTPHLVVHRAFAVTKDGVKAESDGWVITQKDTGLRVASSYKGTLKGGRELAEEIGKRGDWKDQKTAQDTLPKGVTVALGGFAKGQDAGNLNKAIDSVKKVEVKETAGKEPENKWGDVPMLYQGHKGPGVGVLKTDAPHRRDGDKDTVVAERRPWPGS